MASIFIVATLGPAAALEEMSMLTNSPRAASAATVEPTAFLTLTRADFEVILVKYPEISLGLAKDLAERLREAHGMDGVELVSLTRHLNFDPAVVQMLPESLLWRYKMVPVAFVNDTMSLAMVNPSDQDAYGYSADREHQFRNHEHRFRPS